MEDTNTKRQPEDLESETNPSIFKWKNDDTYLRTVETNTLIPKRMREKAKELCKQYEEEYVECCRNHKVMLFLKCQPQNKAFNDCLIKHYKDPALRETCTAQYLEERTQFRRTGVSATKSKRQQMLEEKLKQQMAAKATKANQNN